MPNNKRLEMFADVTSFCNRGCSCCQASANTCDYHHMARETVDLLTERIKESSYEKIIMYVAGGEPLLYPDLIYFFNKLDKEAGEKINLIRLETSGLEASAQNEVSTLQEILKQAWLEKIIFTISFHLFQKNFPERLENMLKMLLEKNYPYRGVVIKILLAQENFQKTFACLRKVFLKLAKIGLFIKPWYLPTDETSINQKLFHLAASHIEHKDKGAEFYETALLCDCVYLAYTYDLKPKLIFVNANTFNPWRGRAKNLKTINPFYDITGCSALKRGFTEPATDYLAISSRGQYFLHECLPGNPPFILGQLENMPLRQAAQMTEAISSELLRRILADQSRFNKHKDLCKICQRQAAQMGIE